MLRTIIAIGASLALSMAFLAACNGDADDGITDADDTEIVDDAVTDDTAVEDDEAVVDEDDEAVEDADDAVVEEDPEAVEEDDDEIPGHAAEEPENAEGHEVVEDTVDVTLEDYEIDMPDTVESGIVAFALTNDGDAPHGIAFQTAGDDENGGQIVGAMLVSAGENEQVELELQPGDYIVFCPVGDHREEHGMETELTVE